MWKEDEEVVTPQQEEQEKKAYIDALNGLANGAQDVDNLNMQQYALPKVDVGKESEIPFRKPNYSDDIIGQAIAQTYDDIDDFKRNRALGDQHMMNVARENGDMVHEGGLSELYKYLPGGKQFRNNIESSYAPSGNMIQIPSQITNGPPPEYIQRQMDADRQEIEDLKRMEAYDILRGLQAYGL